MTYRTHNPNCLVLGALLCAAVMAVSAADATVIAMNFTANAGTDISITGMFGGDTGADNILSQSEVENGGFFMLTATSVSSPSANVSFDLANSPPVMLAGFEFVEGGSSFQLGNVFESPGVAFFIVDGAAVFTDGASIRFDQAGGIDQVSGQLANVSITNKVPEPASLLLLVATAAVTSGFRSRHRP